MKVGGIGARLSPFGDTSVGHAKTKTLDARTSGAIGYQWYMNGEVIDGATGATRDVAWRKGEPDTFTVVPYFDVFGVRTAGVPMSATVTYSRAGTAIIIR